MSMTSGHGVDCNDYGRSIPKYSTNGKVFMNNGRAWDKDGNRTPEHDVPHGYIGGPDNAAKSYVAGGSTKETKRRY